MKKLLFILLCLAVASGASAKFRWGPSAGANFEHYHLRQALIPSDMLVGYNVGLMGEVMIPGIGFGFDFGLKYKNQGGRLGFDKQVIWASDGLGVTDLRMHVIEIPVNLRFKWTRMNGVENYVAPFAFGGPRFNINVANTKCSAIDRKGLSVGLGCGLGVELWKRYQISGGYVWDVTNDFTTYKLDDYYGWLHGWTVDFTILF